LKGLDKSVLIDHLKKIPEMKPTLLDFFSKQIERLTKSTESKEKEAKNTESKEKEEKNTESKEK